MLPLGGCCYAVLVCTWLLPTCLLIKTCVHPCFPCCGPATHNAASSATCRCDAATRGRAPRIALASRIPTHGTVFTLVLVCVLSRPPPRPHSFCLSPHTHTHTRIHIHTYTYTQVVPVHHSSSRHHPGRGWPRKVLRGVFKNIHIYTRYTPYTELYMIPYTVYSIPAYICVCMYTQSHVRSGLHHYAFAWE